MERNDLPAVGGRSLNRPIADLERACLVLLAEEQRTISPNNALIAVLCDTVRLGREYSDAMIEQLKTPHERAVADRLAGEVCRMIDQGDLDARSGAGDAVLDYASARYGDRDPIGDVRRTFNALPTTKPGRRFPVEIENGDAVFGVCPTDLFGNTRHTFLKDEKRCRCGAASRE